MRVFCLCLALAAGLIVPAMAQDAAQGTAEASKAEPTRAEVAYVRREGDPAYEPPPSYAGIVLHPRLPLIDAVDAGIKEQKIVLRARGMTLERSETVIPEDGDAVAAVKALVAERRPAGIVLDLPYDDVSALGHAFAGEPVILFNVRHPHDVLRGAECSPALFHIAASDAMLSDALAQFLRKKQWSKVLVLEGPEPDDKRISAAFQHAAAKYGLKIADLRQFVSSNDPRQRDLANPVLLTAGVTYDVVFVADAVGDFARSVPYQTKDPRPVVGSAGLMPEAWFFAWERQGAPQLTSRFLKATKRPMSAEDFAAWASVKVLVEALARTGSTDPAALRAFLRGPDLTLDVYKGAPSSFRPWDNQLRQAILLHTGEAVVDRPPLEGFLHQTNTLDTLGNDRPESPCKAMPGG